MADAAVAAPALRQKRFRTYITMNQSLYMICWVSLHHSLMHVCLMMLTAG